MACLVSSCILSLSKHTEYILYEGELYIKILPLNVICNLIVEKFLFEIIWSRNKISNNLIFWAACVFGQLIITLKKRCPGDV